VGGGIVVRCSGMDDAREDIPLDVDADSVIPGGVWDRIVLVPSDMEWEWPSSSREDNMSDDDMPPLV
jgi:hypothetical protein